ncbi:hypothetical protein GCM10028825_30370 [Spirosoma agri]
MGSKQGDDKRFHGRRAVVFDWNKPTAMNPIGANEWDYGQVLGCLTNKSPDRDDWWGVSQSL